MAHVRLVHRNSKRLEPPNMTPLKLVLLGKSVSENRRVGNFILGRAAFDSEAPSYVVERVRGRLNNRHVMIINSPQLLQTNISDDQITQTVRECVYLSDPGPHTFIIILQHKDFTEDDMRQVKHVLEKFSKEAFNHSVVITSDEETCESQTSPTIKHTAIHQLIKECGGRHLQLGKIKSEWQFDVLQSVEKILKGSQEEHLTCEIYEDVAGISVDEEQSRSEEESFHHKYDEKHEEISDEGHFHGKQKLNLVLCGSDGSLTASVSKVLRGKEIKLYHQRESNKECIMKKKIIDGRQISVVELPALIGLSEEEVMRHTLNCVSCCDPGVHVFLLILPDAPLTDEDKAEIEKIQKIFDSSEHFMPFFISSLSAEGPDFVKSSPESQRLISLCGGQYRVMSLNEPEISRQIPELLDYIENMTNGPYSLPMYVKAQENRVRNELEERHTKERKRMEDEIKELKQKFKSYGADGEADDQKSLRIVLIGRTGNGKSAAGNTILGRDEFQSQLSTDSVTTVCKKGVGEVDGRSVAVVDTPGLFDTTLSNDQVTEEIMKCVSLSSPGPHVFVIVLSVGRFTKEEKNTVDLIKKIFGPKSSQFSIVLFTRGDFLENESIQDYVKRSKSAELQKLIRDCGNRFLAVNNREKQDKTQVIQLLNMIEEVKNTNESGYFTNSMFEEAEMSIKKRMEQILKEKEREIQAQKEELQARYEVDMKTLKKKLDEEKERADTEKLKIQNQFREKLEKLRKEFEEKEKTEQKQRDIEIQKRSEEEKQQKAEYHQKIKEMKREMENQRSQYEKEQKEREEEERKREEKYRQDEEKIKQEQKIIIANLLIKCEEETKRRETEEKRRSKEEEEERQKWERKVKEAENERKEVQEEIIRQQREWEDEKTQQMREREEDERKRKGKHEEELRKKQEELQKMRERFEREREEERQKILYERKQQRREQEEKERGNEEKTSKMKRHYEQLEKNRKIEWERRKREDDERREEERRRLAKLIEGFKQIRELEIYKRDKEEKERKEREEKEQDEITKNYEEKIKVIMSKFQHEVRKQAEELNDFRERGGQHVQELQQMLEEHQRQQGLLDKLYKHLKDQQDEEIQDLLQAVEHYNNKCSCFIL